MLYAALSLPVVASAGTGQSLTSILQQSFGFVPPRVTGAWLYYRDAYDLANSLGFVASYWNLSSPQVGTWYYYGSAVAPDGSTYVDEGSFDAAVFVAGNDIGAFASVFVGSTWYKMITVDPNLINLPANNQEPTPADIVAEAYRFSNYYGLVPNTADCYNIASAVAAGVGASLGEYTGSLDPTQNRDDGF